MLYLLLDLQLDWHRIGEDITITILGTVHYQWQTKGDREIEPWIYAGIAALLPGYRLAYWLRRHRLLATAGSPSITMK